MLVKKSELVALYVALGLDTVGTWPLAKLVQKTNAPGGIARYRNPGQAITDPDAEKLFDMVVLVQEGGSSVEVEDDGPVIPASTEAVPKKPPAKKPTAKAPVKKPAAVVKPVSKKVPAKKPSVRKLGKKLWSEQLREWEKKPAVLGSKGPGVFQAILGELKAAGKQKNPIGVTKEYLLGVLKEKFPDRDPLKMSTSINNLVPSRLQYKFHIKVEKVRGEQDHKMRYYVTADEAAKALLAPKKPAKKPVKAAAV